MVTFAMVTRARAHHAEQWNQAREKQRESEKVVW
jgi:hypothetical protein